MTIAAIKPIKKNNKAVILSKTDTAANNIPIKTNVALLKMLAIFLHANEYTSLFLYMILHSS
jgi:hypothetical protein